MVSYVRHATRDWTPPVPRPAPPVALPGEAGGGDRWVVSKKTELLRRIRAGEIGFDQACARFDLSAEELETWMRRETVFGAPGLKVCTLQRYR